MALPNAVDGGALTTIPAGTILVIHAPAATDSGWQDYYITAANFLKAVTDSISDIESDIDTVELRMDNVEAVSLIDKTRNVTGAFTKNYPPQTWIEFFAILKNTGSPVVSIGTTSGGTDILNAQPIATFYNEKQGYYCAGSTQLHFTVTGGTIHLAVKMAKSLFTIIT